MGLFDFWKKKPTKSETTTPTSFFTNCTTVFHEEAKKKGIATKGMIFIPELIAPGKKTILAFLQDIYFQLQSGGDPQRYYYLIMALTIDAGMCYATRWHEQFSTLNQYVDEIIRIGPADDANALIYTHLPKEIMGKEGQDFFRIIFTKWLEMHDPYWKLEDPREYTFNAMLAAYQLGVSMILEKYGY